jgi:hypothetical protein
MRKVRQRDNSRAVPNQVQVLTAFCELSLSFSGRIDRDVVLHASESQTSIS